MHQLKVDVRLSLKILIASFLTLSVLLPTDALWAAGEIGDLAIRPAPPAPPLPPAGGKFTDPTYGTPILRVTDRTDGDQASHAYSFWSPFNANSTRFLIALSGSGWTLYDFDPVLFTSKKVGVLAASSGLALDLETARWHPTDPDVLYAMEPSTQRRRLFALNVVTQAATLVHDFTNDAPIGGYPNSLSMSQDGRYFAFYSSSIPEGGQDQGDFVVAYDLQANTVYSLGFKVQTGWSNIHSVFLDKSGTYVAIQAGAQSTGQPDHWVWNFKAGTLEALLWNLADSPGGHWVFGVGLAINPYYNGGQHIARQLATPHTYVPAVTWPLRDGKPNWQMDSHLSWNNSQAGFFFYSNYIGSNVSGWVLESGAIYKHVSFAATGLTQRAPEGVYHNGVSLIQSTSMPAGPGQWYYDAPNDTLYVWLVNNADAANAANVIVAFAWWPFMEEILQVWIDDPTNLAKIRRLAHHQSHWPNTSGYGDMPKASADPSGQFVMFDSNWGGSGHRDVFILNVSGSTLTTPTTTTSPTTSTTTTAPTTSTTTTSPTTTTTTTTVPTTSTTTTDPTKSTTNLQGKFKGWWKNFMDLFK